MENFSLNGYACYCFRSVTRPVSYAKIFLVLRLRINDGDHPSKSRKLALPIFHAYDEVWRAQPSSHPSTYPAQDGARRSCSIDDIGLFSRRNQHPSAPPQRLRRHRSIVLYERIDLARVQGSTSAREHPTLAGHDRKHASIRAVVRAGTATRDGKAKDRRSARIANSERPTLSPAGLGGRARITRGARFSRVPRRDWTSQAAASPTAAGGNFASTLHALPRQGESSQVGRKRGAGMRGGQPRL
jgi:hypothetical protein